MIEAGKPDEGFNKIEINNKSLDLSGISDSNNFSSSVITISGSVNNNDGNNNDNLVLTLIDRYHLSIQYGIWIFHIDNSDMFVNINRVEVLSWSSLVQSVKPHGLLGQTWKRQRGGGNDSGKQVVKEVIEGEVDDYVINGGGGLFGYDFLYNQFQPE